MSDDATTPIGFWRTATPAGAARRWRRRSPVERWCDGCSTPTAYVLAMFRSRQPGQNWLTALGVVLDATICLAAVDSPRVGPAARLWRRASGTLQSLRGMPTALLRPAEADGTATEEAPFREAYERLRGLGVPLHPYEQSLARVPPAAGGLPPRAADGDQAAAGAAGVPAQTARWTSPAQADQRVAGQLSLAVPGGQGSR